MGISNFLTKEKENELIKHFATDNCPPDEELKDITKDVFVELIIPLLVIILIILILLMVIILLN